jgi:RimJ/RimL family protein N-acetyltransferase
VRSSESRLCGAFRATRERTCPGARDERTPAKGGRGERAADGSVANVVQPVLMTDRLVLRPLAPEHLDLEIRLDLDAEVMAYVGGVAGSRADVERSHARRMELATKVEGLGFWMAFARTDPGPENAERTGEFVGLMMLPPAHGPDQPNDPGVADLGYRLARPAWGQGYGREAAVRLLEHAFATVGLDRVIAQTRSDNLRSRRLLEAVGMRFVRTFRSLDDHSDGPLDVEYEMGRSNQASRSSAGD